MYTFVKSYGFSVTLCVALQMDLDCPLLCSVFQSKCKGVRGANLVKLAGIPSTGELRGSGRATRQWFRVRHSQAVEESGCWVAVEAESLLRAWGCPSISWLRVHFSPVCVSWMMSSLWGTPHLGRLRVHCPAACPHPTAVLSPPSLRSSRKWCKCPSACLRWASSGLRSECWVCMGIGGSWE